MKPFLHLQPLFLCLMLGCGPTPVQTVRDLSAQGEIDSNFAELPKRLPSESLPNLLQIHEKVLSGGLPQDELAFGELSRLGVMTIISVDGAKPDIDMAHRFGMRYVHLPHGYDGIPPGRASTLAKAVRELDGKIYIHCHHGQHRSPAAATVACVSAGLLSPAQSLAVLKLAGTSQNYRGLYHAAERASALDPNWLDAQPVDFPEIASVPPLAEAMVKLGHTHERLLLIAKSGWQSPPEHPDLYPEHEALLLREQFTELLRTADVLAQPAEFQAFLHDSELAAEQLERTLSHWNATNVSLESARTAASILADNCIACHIKYRDVPHAE